MLQNEVEVLLEGVAPLGVVGDGGFGPLAAYSTVTSQTLRSERYPAAGCRAGGDDALGERRFFGALTVAARFRMIAEPARGERAQRRERGLGVYVGVDTIQAVSNVHRSAIVTEVQ